MIKKKLVALAMAAIMTLGLAACGDGDSGAKEEKGTEEAVQQETKKEEASEEQIVISVGYPDNPDTSHDKACTLWKEKLEEMSGGTMTMQLYPSSQLGNTNDIIDQILAGQPIITIADGAFYADRGAKDMGIVFGPYLFDNWEDCWKLVESDWWKEQCSLLADLGLTIVADNWVSGTRHTMTTFPVNKVEDFKNKKIRVPDNTIQTKGFEAVGATATPMALTDVYTALQQGTIDGVENPLHVLYANGFQEVAKYLVLDGHVLNFATWCTSTDWYSTLTDEQKKWLTDSGHEAGLYSQELAADSDEVSLKALKDAGVTVKELTEEEKEAFRNEAISFYEDPDLTKQWSPDLYQTVRKAMGK
ncbi:C4-dicarboxylate ABC transporter substrate-binding protein [Lactonifactor longoviformis]|uniref:TRAP-type C4-dicarboxylate transport system, substrate-binding protein n=1 Tax=Lactonifactor longoviformis DSM 17459 TaxID=1122155 RepID=A0A1M4UVN5_9CLOT|nr:C4-dicarboxylate TRAP transporter substrate-binding protein [Lactonifactor longoviformis]POP33784.1 C4-dicarboxylate ABC transporter substrate-binding protein [Lactonifactor longoviformis]SHE60754.1 TRAP-type C4-dicarboxylate transport system, substrate-binding protein [Lactonifactor longoviformis DSM 17459]